MHDLREWLLFSVVEKARLVFVQLSYSTEMEHPSGTQFVNFPQVQCFPDKRQVTNLLIFSCSLSPATIAWLWSFCHVSVFSLSRSSRDSSVIFERLALNVDVETDA